jgi:transcription termination factor NusB
MEACHEIAMSHERYIGAWRSVNDIQAQAGPEKFKLLLDRIREKIADLDDVVVPYKTRAWTVTKKEQ